MMSFRINRAGVVIGIAFLLLLSTKSFAQEETGIEFFDVASAGSGTLNSVFFLDSDNGWIGASGNILKTTDAGESWKGSFDYIAGVHESIYFTDSQNGWAVDRRDGILKTVDGGENWGYQFNSSNSGDLNSIYFADSQKGWVAGHDRILHTPDGGANWADQINGISKELYSVYFTDGETGWSVGEDGIIYRTTNGGEDWETASSGTTEDLFSVYFANETTGWAVGNNGTILHTTDGGENWTSQSSGVSEHLNSVYFTSSTTGWIAGNGGTILYTDDSGGSWVTKTTNDTYNLNSVYFTESSKGWFVGDNGRIIEYTALESLSSPEISVPANNSQVSPPFTLEWEPEVYSDHIDFTIEISTDPDFSEIIQKEENYNAHSLQLNYDQFENNTTYYWRVRRVAKSDSDFTSEWTESSFTMAIDKPVLITPGDKAIVTLPFDFTWESEKDPDNYTFNIQASEYADFSELLYDEEGAIVTSLSSASLGTLTENRSYFWRIQRQYNSADLSSEWVTAEFMVKPEYIILQEDSTFITEPNYVNIMLHAEDISGEGITFLENDEFVLSENGSPISPTESRYQVDRLDRVNSKLNTVMVLDNSQSIGEENLELIKDAASEFVKNKLPNQSIAIYVFARQIEKKIDFTAEEQELLDIINDIELAELSGTNLYGAAIAGLEDVGEDVFGLDYIEQNFMILFTDGQDIANEFTLYDVNAARGFKEVYAIGIEADPDDFDAEALREIGNAGTFIDPDFNNVLNQFLEVQESLERKSNSFYWLNYASATVNANSELVVKVKNNENTSLSSQITYPFDASGFYDTPDEITVNPSYENPFGVDSLTITTGDTAATKIFSIFSFETQPFEFSISDTTSLSIEPADSEPFVWNFTGSGKHGEEVKVVIKDTVYTEEQIEKTLVVNFAVDPPEEIVTDANITFGDTGSPEDYRLVALPGSSNTSLGNILEGNHEIHWQAYWDDGTDEDYLVKYDGSEQFAFQPGNGFWVTHQDLFSYNDILPMVELDDQNQARIPLHEGWNIISNPLDIDVSWDEVSSANGDSLQPIWRFDGSFEEAAKFASARFGEAFYFLNDQELEELTIPYVPASVKEKEGDKQRELRLITVEKDYETSSSSIAFYRDKQKHRPDIVAPPGGFERASLRFTTPEEPKNKRTNTFARIYREHQTEGQQFPVRLTAKPEQPVTIKAEGIENYSMERLVILDPKTGKTYDLLSPQSVQYVPQERSTDLLLVMGDSRYLNEQQNNMLPEQVSIKPNYPNPFNPTTTLQFALPEQSEVRVQVYDMIGRKVSTLVNEVREAGIHTVTFDASRQASGMYFAVFEIGSHRHIQKMMLIK